MSAIEHPAFEGVSSEATKHIADGGSKIGLLTYLSTLPGGEDYVMPHVAVHAGEEVSDAHVAKLMRLCERMEVRDVICRTTHAADYAGMVDVMPTTVVDTISLDRLNEELKKLRAIVSRPEIKTYSDRERSGFVAAETTVSFAPRMCFPTWTLTEHPNHPDVLLIDSYDGAYTHREHNIWGNTGEHVTPHQESYLAPQQLGGIRHAWQWLRETRQFGDTRALQVEGVFDMTGSPRIVQIRDFAKKVHLDQRELRSAIRPDMVRVFWGALPPDDIHVPIYFGTNRREAMEKGEATGEPYILSPHHTGNRLDVGDQPLNMHVYMSKEPRGALAHQNTRFVKMAVDRGGVGVLSTIGKSALETAADGDVIRITKHKDMLRITNTSKAHNVDRQGKNDFPVPTTEQLTAAAAGGKGYLDTR